MPDKHIAEPVDLKTPRFCWTATGMPIHQGKVLLIKHKKLGIWLCPGGHMEEGELPHQCAERETFEETGLRVQAVTALQQPRSMDTEYQPVPLYANLHWICKENYDARLASLDRTHVHPSPKWPRGCEQHFTFVYLVELVNSPAFIQNKAETDGIGWFGLEEVSKLETLEGIREEILSVLRTRSTSF